MFMVSYSVSWRTACTSWQRNVSFTLPWSLFWVISWQEDRPPEGTGGKKMSHSHVSKPSSAFSWICQLLPPFYQELQSGSHSSYSSQLYQNPLCLVPRSWGSFVKAKQLFNSSIPVLVHPDIMKQFIVKVDVCDSVPGAVLALQSGPQGKLQPCAFFSHWLTPPEQHYDVRDRELLAIKLALEELSRLLGGTKQPFIIWTNHNLP